VNPSEGETEGDDWFDNTLAEFNFFEKIEGWHCNECGDHDLIFDRDDADPVSFDSDYEVVAKTCGTLLKKEQKDTVPWSCDTWQVTLLRKERERGSNKRASSDGDRRKRNDSSDRKEGRHDSSDREEGPHGGTTRVRTRNSKAPKGGRGDEKRKRKLNKLNKRRKRRALQQRRRHERYEYLVVLTVTYSDQFETREDAIEECPDKVVYRTEDILDSEFGLGAIQLVLYATFAGHHITNPCTWDCFEDPDDICH